MKKNASSFIEVRISVEERVSVKSDSESASPSKNFCFKVSILTLYKNKHSLPKKVNFKKLLASLNIVYIRIYYILLHLYLLRLLVFHLANLDISARNFSILLFHFCTSLYVHLSCIETDNYLEGTAADSCKCKGHIAVDHDIAELLRHPSQSVVAYLNGTS